MPMPIALDHQGIRQDLHKWGWNDYKIEGAIGSAVGYMAKLNSGQTKQMSYGFAARLYNLWEQEAMRRYGVSPQALSDTAYFHTLTSVIVSA